MLLYSIHLNPIHPIYKFYKTNFGLQSFHSPTQLSCFHQATKTNLFLLPLPGLFLYLLSPHLYLLPLELFFFFLINIFTYSLSLSLNILMCNLEPNNARPFLLLQEPTPHFASLYCVAVTCPEPHNPLILLLLLLSFSIFCFLYFLVLFSPKL